MQAPLLLLLAVLACVEAVRYGTGFRYERRVIANDTFAGYSNITTSTTPLIQVSTKPSVLPPISSSTTASATLTCIGLVTYYGSVPPTVYSTVTEAFQVTVSASNVSVTASETLITPPPACEATVMPLDNSFQPLATIAVSSKLPANSSDLSDAARSQAPQADSAEDWGSTTTQSSQAQQTDSTEDWGSTTTRKSPWAPEIMTSSPGAPAPEVPVPAPVAPPPTAEAPRPSRAGESPAESYTVVTSIVYATAPFTSTVIVTKKTPVIVVSPQTSRPPTFQQPGGPPPQNPQQSPPSNAPSNNRPPPSAGPGAAPDSRPGTTAPGLGPVIISLIQSQSFASAEVPARQTTIANVPIVVLPSTVIIGTNAIAIPKSSEAVATVAGQVFTVRPSEIVASAGFVAFDAPGDSQNPSRELTVAPGVVAQVGDSTAVIAGTTYRIGKDAPATTITVAGVAVGIGSQGIALPSTTVAANAVTNAPMVVESAGGLTFAIDQTQVAIDGTTYRIGPGAAKITTEIGGQTVSIGPGGVGLEKTTLEPTAATEASDTGAAATSSGLIQGSSATNLLSKSIGVLQTFVVTLTSLAGGWLLL